MLALVMRGLRQRKLRVALTVIAIALGVALMAGTYILTDTINNSFASIFQTANKGHDVVVTPAQRLGNRVRAQVSPIDEAMVARVRAVPGVAVASGSIFTPVTLLDTAGKRLSTGGAPAFAASVVPKRFESFSPVSGRFPASASEVAIDQFTQQRKGLRLGQQMVVAGSAVARRYTIVGIVQFAGAQSFGGAAAAVLVPSEAQRVTGQPGRYDQIDVAAESDPTHPVTASELRGRIRAALPSTVEVRTGAEQAAKQTSDLEENLSFLRTFLLVFAYVSLFVGAFIIFNTFSITVAQRTREFGLLRTLGASRGQLLRSVVFEGLLLGVGGSLIGLLCGIALAPGLDQLFKSLGADLPDSGTVLQTRTVVVSLLVGTAITLLAAVVPARRATRVPPIAALREGVELPRRRWLRWRPRVVPALARAVGVLVSWRGITGRLARENAMRQPGRTMVTAAALMVGLALVTFVAVLADGTKATIDQAVSRSFAGDLIIENSQANGREQGIPALVASAVRRVPGVRAVTPIAFTVGRPAGSSENATITAVEPATFERVYRIEWKQGSVATLLGLDGTGAVVSEGYAKAHGLKVGSAIVLLTPTERHVRVRIAGIVKDRARLLGDLTISLPLARAAFGQREDALNFVSYVPGASNEQVQPAVDRLLATAFPQAKSRTAAQFKQEQSEQINTLLTLIYVLLALSVVVSLFGIVNTLVLSIYERTRELGMMRAIGTSRRQVRQMIRYESVITALIGGVLGLLIGVVGAVLVTTFALSGSGFVQSIPLGTLAILLVVAALAGLVAEQPPGRRAARIDLLEALASE
jgi:putative ABC transport system permease protein